MYHPPPQNPMLRSIRKNTSSFVLNLLFSADTLIPVLQQSEQPFPILLLYVIHNFDRHHNIPPIISFPDWKILPNCSSHRSHSLCLFILGIFSNSAIFFWQREEESRTVHRIWYHDSGHGDMEDLASLTCMLKQC